MKPIDKLRIDLSQRANTMEEFLKICAEHYDFKNCKLGLITKTALINNIGTVINSCGAKPKTPMK